MWTMWTISLKSQSKLLWTMWTTGFHVVMWTMWAMVCKLPTLPTIFFFARFSFCVGIPSAGVCGSYGQCGLWVLSRYPNHIGNTTTVPIYSTNIFFVYLKIITHITHTPSHAAPLLAFRVGNAPLYTVSTFLPTLPTNCLFFKHLKYFQLFCN